MNVKDQVLVVFNAAPNLEDDMIDWLLTRDGGVGFTTVSVSGHSSKHSGLTAAEQVSGRRMRLRFEVHMAESRVSSFLQDAKSQLGKLDVHCVVYPILAAGSLNDVADSMID